MKYLVKGRGDRNDSSYKYKAFGGKLDCVGISEWALTSFLLVNEVGMQHL